MTPCVAIINLDPLHFYRSLRSVVTFFSELIPCLAPHVAPGAKPASVLTGNTCRASVSKAIGLMRSTAKELHPQLWSAKSSAQRSEPRSPKVKMDGDYIRWKCVNYELPGLRGAALSVWPLYCASCWPVAASFFEGQGARVVRARVWEIRRGEPAKSCRVFLSCCKKGSFQDCKHVISVAFSPIQVCLNMSYNVFLGHEPATRLSNRADLHTLCSWRFRSLSTLEADEVVPETQKSKQTKKMCNIWRWVFVLPDFHLMVRNISDGPKEAEQVEHPRM